MASGISYHPSTVKTRKTEYMELRGVSKYCGATSLYRPQLIIPKMNNNKKKPINTIPESRNARLRPAPIWAILGKKCSIRNKRKIRINRKVKRIEKLNVETSTNGIANDGNESSTNIPSILFQPFRQYRFMPKVICLTTISATNINVQVISRMIRIGWVIPDSYKKKTIVLSKITPNIICSFNRKRLI